MTITHEHYIFRDNILPRIKDAITLTDAVDLTGATYQFVYSKPGTPQVVRNASLVEDSVDSLTEATEFRLEFAPTADDTEVAGVYNYFWRIWLSGSSAPFDVSAEISPESDGTPRRFARFEVKAPFENENDVMATRQRFSPATIAALRAIRSHSSNFLAEVISDANGNFAMFKWVEGEIPQADDGNQYIQPDDYETTEHQGYWERLPIG